MAGIAPSRANGQSGAQANRDVHGRFLTGSIGGPGRPMGSRNKLGEDFVAALSEDWSKHGASVIALVRESAPVAYLRVIASLVPQHVAITTGDELADMTDEQLREELIKSMAATADEMGMPDVARAVRRHAVHRADINQLPSKLAFTAGRVRGAIGHDETSATPGVKRQI